MILNSDSNMVAGIYFGDDTRTRKLSTYLVFTFYQRFINFVVYFIIHVLYTMYDSNHNDIVKFGHNVLTFQNSVFENVLFTTIVKFCFNL